MNKNYPSVTGRRTFLKACAGGIGLGLAASCAGPARQDDRPFFGTRGVVLIPDDLTLADWPERAHAAGLSTIALHHGSSPRRVAAFVASPAGERFLAKCRDFRIAVEYELHAMAELLPRALYKEDPNLFRVNEKGSRTPDANLCVHSERALSIVGENALAISRKLRPTTHRYFLWGDDGLPWCRCASCAEFTDSDQALFLEIWLIQVLRTEDPQASLAHLAYANTLEAPTKFKPPPGIFLEYAPYERRYDVPLTAEGDAIQRHHRDALDANLELFGSDHAQALEYWLDVSKFSRYRKPAQKLVFDERILAADLDFYASRKIRHVTTFACYIDADYVSRWGDPPLASYGAALNRLRSTSGRPEGRAGTA
jgi:hypothetical protein